MKGTLFHQAMLHDIWHTIFGVIVVTFIEVTVAMPSWFAHIGQWKSFHQSIVEITIILSDHFSCPFVLCIFSEHTNFHFQDECAQVH